MFRSSIKRLYPFVLIFASTILSLLSVEIFLHYFKPPDERVANRVERIPHPIYHHAMKPGAQGRSVSSEWSVQFSINHLGFRDDEPQKQSYKIIALGDSFTEGVGVEQNDTFVQVAERILKRKNSEIEIINMGITSFSPILEYLLLKETLDRRDFDFSAVLLFLDLSDIQDDYKYEEIAEFNPEGELIKVPPIKVFWKKPEKEPALNSESKVKHLRLFRLYQSFFNDPYEKIKKEYSTEIEDRGDIRYDRYGLSRPDVDWTVHFERTAKYLLKIKQLLDLQGKEFFLILYPYPWNIDAFENPKGRVIRGFEPGKIYDNLPFFEYFEKFSAENQIRFLNAAPLLKEAKQKNPKIKLSFDYDPHFSKEAHFQMGVITADFLTARLKNLENKNS